MPESLLIARIEILARDCDTWLWLLLSEDDALSIYFYDGYAV